MKDFYGAFLKFVSSVGTNRSGSQVENHCSVSPQYENLQSHEGRVKSVNMKQLKSTVWFEPLTR